jgi:tellurite resistance protein TerC
VWFVKQGSQRSFRLRLRQWLHLEDVPPFVRRVIVAVIGGTILLMGIAMIVLPGPAVVVIPLGLAVLATEFIWARRWLRKARKMFQRARDGLSSKPTK